MANSVMTQSVMQHIFSGPLSQVSEHLCAADLLKMVSGRFVQHSESFMETLGGLAQPGGNG